MADEGSEQVGLWDLALPIYCIDVTPIDGGPRGTASYVAPTGTGFCVAPGVLVTCWHCVKPRSDGRRYAAVSWNGAELGHHLLNRISQDPTGLDLATAQIDYEPVQRFAPWPDADTVGTDVWSVGYPLTESDALPSGMRQWHPEPRYLRGYVTRVFVNPDHPDFGPQRSYELDMAMPGGMSGGPLLARNIFNSGLWITGVCYGSHDVYTVAEEASVDPESGIFHPEVRRYVSFGLAHHLDGLLELRGEATDDRPVRALLGEGGT